MCMPYVCVVAIKSKNPDPLELELQMVVGHYEDAGNQTLCFYKSSPCSLLLNHLYTFNVENTSNNLILYSEDCIETSDIYRRLFFKIK